MRKPIKAEAWVERMSLAGIAVFLVRGILSDTTIIYDERNIYPLARRILNLLRGVKLCSNFYSANLFLLDKKDTEGKTLRYRVNKDLNECIKNFIENHIPDEHRRFKNMLKSYMAHHLERKVIFITKVCSEIEARADKSLRKDIIYINKNHLSYLIVRFYRRKGFTIKEEFNLIEALKFYFRPLGFMAGLFIGMVFKKKISGNISGIQPSVWIEYHPSFLHILWFSSIKAEGFDIVGYLDRPDTPVTAKAIHDIKATNAKWIDAHLLPLMGLSKPKFTQIRKLWMKSFSITSSRPAWPSATPSARSPTSTTSRAT